MVTYGKIRASFEAMSETFHRSSVLFFLFSGLAVHSQLVEIKDKQQIESIYISSGGEE